MVSENKKPVGDVKAKNVHLRDNLRDWGGKIKHDTFKMGNDPKTLKMLNMTKMK